MDQETQELGFEAIKYVILFASVPIWGPFAKALWDEFLLALRADGGLTGHEPNRRERAAIEEEILASGELSQVHEPIAHVRPGTAGGRPAGGAGAPARSGGPQRGAGPQVGGQRRPFGGAAPLPPAAGNRPRFR